MIDQLRDLDPLVQAGLAGGFTWLITALGSAIVLFVGRPGERFLDTMLGFAAGVMLAASVWSLLLPAIEHSENGRLPAWVPAAGGLAIGAGGLWAVDQLLPHIHPFQRGATLPRHGEAQGVRLVRQNLLVGNPPPSSRGPRTS